MMQCGKKNLFTSVLIYYILNLGNQIISHLKYSSSKSIQAKLKKKNKSVWKKKKSSIREENSSHVKSKLHKKVSFNNDTLNIQICLTFITYV